MSVSRHTLAAMIEKEKVFLEHFVLLCENYRFACLIGRFSPQDRQKIIYKAFLMSVKVFELFLLFILSLFKDILENESINLDWMFRYSLINDIVKVRRCQTG